jgi:hypothetical protein
MRILLMLALGALCPCAPAATAPQSPTTVRFENHSDFAYDGWAHATVPLPPGSLPDPASLADYTLAGAGSGLPVPTVAAPLKWHWSNGVRTSVALVKVRAQVHLPPRAAVDYRVQPGQNATGLFQWDPELWNWVHGGTIRDDVFLVASFVGDPNVYVARPPGVLKSLEQSTAEAVFRGRTRFRRLDDPTITHALTLTTYWSLQSGESHGDLTLVLGNDTLERPVPGGIQVESVYLLHRRPFRALPRYHPTSAVHGPTVQAGYVWWQLLGTQTLADAQTHAVDFSFCVTADNVSSVSSMYAAAVSPLVGIADADSWRQSQAAGPVGFVPLPRFPNVTAARALIESAALPASGPADDLSVVNRNPSDTGDQPDFASNIPVFYLQSVQTGSNWPLAKALVGVRRESWRPSNYWCVASSGLERASLVDFPDLFFWSGRPHYDPSWNLQYPIWNTRAGGFVPGPSAGWGGMDNQHCGHNALRAVYELTADPYVGDLLAANMSILYWDFFTDWMAHTEAERTGRMLKEAILLCTLFPDTPEAARLRTAITQKLGVFLSTANGFVAQYGFPAIASVRDDPRVPLTTKYPNQDVHMSWQTGFHMEALVLAAKWLGDPSANQLLQLYLDRADLLFLPNGMPKTYTLMSDPSQCSTGGIGLGWWSGWVLADEYMPSRLNHALLQQQVLPRIRDAITPAANLWWSSDDRWRCFN